MFLDLLKPYSFDTFCTRFWDREPLVLRDRNAHIVRNIFTMQGLDEVLRRNDLRYPALRLVANGREISLEKYTKKLRFGEVSDLVIEIDRLFKQIQLGATLILELRLLSPEGHMILRQQLEQELGFGVDMSAFFTPRQSVGLRVHYDTSASMIIQAHGSKHWKVFAPYVRQPYLDETYREDQSQNTELLLDVELNAGDALFIPRGFPHEPITVDSESLHVTLAIFPPMWRDILEFQTDRLTTAHRLGERLFSQVELRYVRGASNEDQFRAMLKKLPEMLSSEENYSSADRGCVTTLTRGVSAKWNSQSEMRKVLGVPE